MVLRVDPFGLGEDDDEGLDRREIDLQSAVAAEIASAVQYVDSDIAPVRAAATDAYLGRPYGTEEDGRSKVITHDVRDTTAAMMPALMRVFCSSERVVEYQPVGPEDVAGAEQATDYANYIFMQENQGYLVLYSAIKDALNRKAGFVKAWVDESQRVTSERLTGLPDDALQLLAVEPGIELVEQMSYPDPASAQLELAGLQPTMLHDVTVRRTETHKRIRIEALPPEEFLINRDAVSIDTARIVAHRTQKTVSDLIAMGYERDLIERYAGEGDDMVGNEERLARNLDADLDGDHGADPLLREVTYVEAYVLHDYDGDGIAELLKVCCMGGAHKVVHHEPCDVRPFADFHVDPEPHTFLGLCLSDETYDIQYIKTHLMRAVLDSLAQSVFPRMGVVEGEAVMADVLNTEIGAPIRMTRPGMVTPFITPFVGKEAFPVLDYMDQVKEQRTGQSKASLGLDADALQSTTRAAVAATVSASQARQELIARNLAETGMRKLMKLILRLVCQHQDRARMVRLRGQWVPIDPRAWDAGMDVVVNIALGSGSTEEKLAVLERIIAKQEQLLQLLGPSNPVVSLHQYTNALSRYIELSGWRDTSQFLNRVPADWQPQAQAPKPSPEELLAQAQADETRARIAKTQGELALDRERMLLEDDRKRDEFEADVILRAAEISAKYSTQVDIAGIKAMMERDRRAQSAPRFDA